MAVAEPEGAAAVQTLTLTGTSERSGTLRIRIAGRHIVVGAPGSTAENIAASLADHIAALHHELPITATRTDAGITCTHVTAGKTAMMFATMSPRFPTAFP